MGRLPDHLPPRCGRLDAGRRPARLPAAALGGALPGVLPARRGRRRRGARPGAQRPARDLGALLPRVRRPRRGGRRGGQPGGNAVGGRAGARGSRTAWSCGWTGSTPPRTSCGASRPFASCSSANRRCATASGSPRCWCPPGTTSPSTAGTPGGCGTASTAFGGTSPTRSWSSTTTTGTGRWVPCAVHDALLVNSTSDGMNVVVQEAAVVNRRAGVAVLSTGAGAYELLGDHAVPLTSPRDVGATAEALASALSLDGGRAAPAGRGHARRGGRQEPGALAAGPARGPGDGQPRRRAGQPLAVAPPHGPAAVQPASRRRSSSTSAVSRSR